MLTMPFKKPITMLMLANAHAYASVPVKSSHHSLAKRGQFEYRQNVSCVYFSLVRDRSTDTVQPSPVYYMRYSVP